MRWLWTLPMNLLAWLLVKLARATKVDNYDPEFHTWWNEYVVESGWLHRWFKSAGFAAITPSSDTIIWRDRPGGPRLLAHELVHLKQHRRYGPFFLLVYGWYSLRSRLSGTGWYKGNKLEREARGEE